jgi:hypothetical protein
MSNPLHTPYRKEDKLEDAIITLHDIARVVEKEVGVGKLSSDIRDCADRLHTLTKPMQHQGVEQ